VVIHARLQRWRFAITAALLALLLTLFQVPARAAGGGDGCNPGRSSNYVHYYYSGTDDISAPSSYGGIYGNIYNYSPYVYSSSSSDSDSQWVMLDHSGTDWAQVGWIEFPGSVRHTFVQFNDPGVDSWTNYFAPFTINSDPEYEVDYNPSCPHVGCFAFYANGTWLTGTGHSFTPDDAQSAAEIHDKASQIPGGYNNTSYALNLHVYYNAGASGSWHSMNGHNTAVDQSGNPAPSWDNVSGNGTNGNSSYSSWDSACSN
jgi:hypothetical protein